MKVRENIAHRYLLNPVLFCGCCCPNTDPVLPNSPPPVLAVLACGVAAAEPPPKILPPVAAAGVPKPPEDPNVLLVSALVSARKVNT